jgi:peptidoglycan hydrolase-like protein with peptidoglycan-binding domain
MRVFTLLCCLMLSTGTIHGGASPHGAPVVNEVLATQLALDRSGFSPGEIDGRAGRNVQRALAAFQGSHELRATGRMDDQTWKPLAATGGDVPPLVDYTITNADVAGPFTPDIPRKLPDQATLDALNYRTPLEALGEMTAPSQSSSRARQVG